MHFFKKKFEFIKKMHWIGTSIQLIKSKTYCIKSEKAKKQSNMREGDLNVGKNK